MTDEHKRAAWMGLWLKALGAWGVAGKQVENTAERQTNRNGNA